MPWGYYSRTTKPPHRRSGRWMPAVHGTAPAAPPNANAGTGDRNLIVDFDAGFQHIIGASVDSAYTGMLESYQKFSYVYPTYIDNYVGKPNAVSRMRTISFVIFGEF